MRIAWEKIEAENLQLKKQLREKDEEIDGLRAELDDLRSQYNKLNDLYEEAIDDINTLEGELDSLGKG